MLATTCSPARVDRTKENLARIRKGEEKGRRTRRSPKDFVMLFIVTVNARTERHVPIPTSLYPQEVPMIRPGRVHAMVPHGHPAQRRGHGALRHQAILLAVGARVKGNLADSG